MITAVGLAAAPSYGAGGAAARARHATAADAPQAQIGFGADLLGTSWFQNQRQLTPQLVTGGTFGRVFTKKISTKGYPQPLVDANTLLVEDQNNDIYGLNPTTGGTKWTRHLATPFNPSQLGCGATQGAVGVTGTPVVDPATHVEYFVYKDSAGQNWMDARQTATGNEVAGFPVAIQGSAWNAPSINFNSRNQLQRPGLLIENGVVYAAFGSHCDRATYEGWVVGVKETGGITSLWSDVHQDGGAGGIWVGGAGLVADGPNTMLLSTGNGTLPTHPTLGDQTPGQYGEAVVRLRVNTDGTLSATDFFTPYDAAHLNDIDGDLGSGAPAELPAPTFGTPAHPHLAVEIGKEGYLYLLDADHLGGYEQGPNGGDDVLERLGPFGGVWGKPAVFGGNGGYVYMVDSSSIGGSGKLIAFHYGVDANGNPRLAEVGQSSDAFAYGSTMPIVTSTTSPDGTGIVWVAWTPQTNSTTGELRAYSAVPNPDGTMNLLKRFPLDNGPEKLSEPLVYNNRIYFLGLGGIVYCYGAPVSTPLSANGLTFPDTVVGQPSTATLTFTANGNQTITGFSSGDPQFHVGTPTRKLPAAMTNGQLISVPVTFTPTAEGEQGTSITAAVSGATYSAGVNGFGVSPNAELTVLPRALSFGGSPPGQAVTSGVNVSNTGSKPLTISNVTQPSAPFSTSGLPTAGTVIQPGQVLSASATFLPTQYGTFDDQITIDAGAAGTSSVALSGSSAAPGKLAVTPTLLTFPTIAAGGKETMNFTLTNSGGTTIEITKSQPPVANAFRAVTSLQEGSSIAAGQTVTETVQFAPAAAGTFHDSWVINSNGSGGAVQVQMKGTAP